MATTTIMLKLIVLYVAINVVSMTIVTAEKGKVGAPMFIFGDSTMDVGTNNYLPNSTSRADHPYNGIDFADSKPTGRFSNGKNAADQLAKLLGNYKASPPPFLSFLKQNQTYFNRTILRGANFASGGSGVFNQTGSALFKQVISMEDQIKQFATYRSNITQLLGSQKAVDALLRKSIYIISVGGNDLVEYAMFHRGQIGDPKQLIFNLTKVYSIHLTNLYNLGARKFGIIGVPPIGCCPASRGFNATGGCYEAMNDNARSFYKSLATLLSDSALMYKDFKYSLGNSYEMAMNVIDNPRGNRFKEVKTACCGSGNFKGEGDCVTGASLCNNRDDYLFWDKVHPTQKVSQLAALTLVYGEGSEYVTPMNFSSLAMT
ncbi:GDSL esterase/lipase At5g37690-like [Rutidosis leptorrhynchoides]|uniref:GDSL esterase/lipase At5g37690-like n=1 Tax=Rutidosis leptorrhynchoides TaxID=125765 RepID=UPI003A997703